MFEFIIVIFMTIVKKKVIKYNKERGEGMIHYAPFWETLRTSKESTYTLIKNHGVSSATLDKLRKNKPVNTTTINDLCRILDCPVESIIQYLPSDQDQKL